MELIAILSLLWARRVLVGLGLLTAIAGGVLALRVISPAPGPPTWVASTRVLLDTPHSQLVSVEPPGAATLATRAHLLADLMASDPLKALVAREAGVPLDELDVLGPSSRLDPPALSPLVTKAQKFATLAPARYVVNLYADGRSSIISVEAGAPDAARAATLAGAAVSVLRSSLAPSLPSPAPRRGRNAPREQQAGTAKAFLLTQLGPTRATQAPGHSRRRLLVMIGSLLAFALWCAGIVLVSGLARRVRLPQPA